MDPFGELVLLNERKSNIKENLTMSHISTNVADKLTALRVTRIGEPIVRFSDGIGKVAISLETRTDEELENDARLHPDPVTREQALYNLIQRRGPQAMPVV